ncbi:MAG TPA: DUF6705 family protein [Flavobacteriaceae bacterium]|nr:DUF6705 family protein [Flavobacteriaceae bacterium]
MKNFLLLMVCLIPILFSKAQAQTIPLLDGKTGIKGAYYKDLDNDLDQFVGTWKWVDGNSSLLIVIEKRIQVYYPYGNLYKDVLIGGYQYIENGISVVNTIPMMNNIYSSPYSYSIVGSSILDSNDGPPCAECLPTERRVRLFMDDPEREYIPVTITLRHYGGDISVPGQDPPEFIHMVMRSDSAILPTETSPTWIRVPRQEYTLEKQ